MKYHVVTLPSGESIELPRVSSIVRTFNQREQLGKKQYYGSMGMAAHIGSLVHDGIARINSKELISPEDWQSYPETVRQAIRAYIRWARSAHFRPLHNELPVYSLQHLYSGTIDCIGRYGRESAICDWKSGNELEWELVKAQVAAYWYAYLEMHKRRSLSNIIVVRLDKTTGRFYETKLSMIEITDSFDKFLKLKEKAGIV